MTKEEAIETLRANYPDACYEQLREAVNVAIEVLKAQDTAGDCISRQAAIDAIRASTSKYTGFMEMEMYTDDDAVEAIEDLPSAQAEPLSDAYMKAVWTWLLNYQIKVAELKGRYTPYEVLSWVANDWRKEHEGLD